MLALTLTWLCVAQEGGAAPRLLPPAEPAAAALPDAATPGRGEPRIDVERYSLQILLVPPLPRIRALAQLEVRLREDTDHFELDLHAGLRVTEVRVAGLPQPFQRREHRLRVAFPRPRAAGERLTVAVRYGGSLPDDVSQGEPVGLLSDGVALVGYAQPDGAHHWFPCSDHPSDKAPFELRVRVPAGDFAAATGELRGWRPGLGWQEFHWRTRRPLATYLVAVAAGPYEPILRPAPVPILDLALPGDRDTVERSLQPVAEMIPFLAERFGPYPFERYGQVYTHLPVGGLENQTMTVLGRGAGLSGDPALLVHELGHQWFGDWVSPRQWRDLWLNEGWATYCELLWAEATGGDAGRRRTLRPWRRSVLRLARYDGPWTLAEPNPEELFDTHLVYNKGGMVLHLLAEYLGREVFYAAAREYLRIHAGGNAGTADFQAVLSRHAGVDLEPFFAAWVRSNGVPQLRSTWQAAPRGDRWKAVVSLEQVQSGPWHPFAGVARFASQDGTLSQETGMRFHGPRAALAVELDFAPATFQFDPNGELPWQPAD